MPVTCSPPISQVRHVATEAGNASGILAPVKAEAERYLNDGFTMVAVGSDLALLGHPDRILRLSFSMPIDERGRCCASAGCKVCSGSTSL